MATIRSCSGLVTASGSFREVLSGDGLGSGPVCSFTNGITLKASNFDGWLLGEGTVNGITGGNDGTRSIRISNSVSPFGTWGTASFNPDFDPLNKYLVGIYFEMLTNTSGDGFGRGVLANGIKISAPTWGLPLLSHINVVGDVLFLLNQNFPMALTSANDQFLLSLVKVDMALAGAPASYVESATFKFCALFRTAQYAVK
jgi:hypothetical protein